MWKKKSQLHCLSLKDERIKRNGIVSITIQFKPSRISWQGGKYPDIRSPFSSAEFLLGSKAFTTLVHLVAINISPPKHTHRNSKAVYIYCFSILNWFESQMKLGGDGAHP